MSIYSSRSQSIKLMKDVKASCSYYNDVITHIAPLLMYMAPIKQRAVLEVLVRKSVGVTIDFTDRKNWDDGGVDIKSCSISTWACPL